MFANKFVKYAVTAPKSSIRLMSGHKGTPAEMRADVNRWKQISVVMTIGTALTCLYVYINPEIHVDQRTDLAYLKCKSKPFPWKECSDCGLLEMPCWIACKQAKKDKEEAAKAAASAHSAH